MGYFLPSFFQKRLLRYAISRLELVDTDALDLDRLDIAWGQRSTLELRDVGLRLEKLSTLLRLPKSFELTKARILLLRLTIPSDIYSSGILVEVEGVHVNLRLLPETNDIHTGLRKAGLAKGVRSNRPRSTTQSLHDPGGKGPRGLGSAGADDGQPVLPSTTDLAQSFLQAEPKEEREELEAAIVSQSQYGQQSVSSSDEGDEEVGLGTQGVSLPSFIAGFLKGVGDRLQVKINNVSLNMDMEVPRDLDQRTADSVTAQLVAENLDIEGLTRTNTDSSESGKRHISLQKVRAMLIADPLLFAKYSTISAPTSPLATQQMHAPSQAPSSPSKSSSSISSGARLAMTHSTIFEPTGSVREESRTLESSVVSNDGRFSDAGTETEHGIDRSIGDASALDSSRYQDSVLDNPSYLDSVLDEVEDENMEDSIASHPASPSSSRQNMSQQRQPSRYTSTPTSRGSPPRSPRPESGGPSYASIDNQTNAITRTQSDPERAVDFSLLIPRTTGNLSPRDASPHSEHSSNSTPHNSSPGEDLSESKLFTHEEAESMYMSAVSHASEARSQELRMPGGWGDEPSSRGESPPRKPTSSRLIDPQGLGLQSAIRNLDEVLDERCPTPTPQTPRVTSAENADEPRTPTKSEFRDNSQGQRSRLNEDELNSNSSNSSDGLSRLAKPVLTVDSISVWLPSDEPIGDCSADMSGEAEDARPTFPKSPKDESQESSDAKKSMEIDISAITVQFDFSIGWLITKIFQRLSHLWTGKTTDDLKAEDTPAAASHPLKLMIEKLSLNFLEHLRGEVQSNSAMSNPKLMRSLTTESDVLLRTTVLGLKAAKTTAKDITKTQVDITKFILGFASENIISFDAGLKIRESTRDIQAPTRGDISLLVSASRDTSSASVTTLPMHLSLNIPRLDEMFGWFGGLSGFLELGSSIASVSTIVGGGSPKVSRSPKRPRGVHFEQPKEGSLIGSDFLTPAKANARIGGLMVDIRGKDCSVLVETTAVKIVNRPEITAIQVDKAKLSGPYFGDDNRDTAFDVDIFNTRVEYLFTPQEQDLDKLLSLLTPSKSKYDQDDDIMLDTLFRQRRQGPVLRINVEGVRTFAFQSSDLDLLLKLAEEMSTLSKVAKYLPEDDRPGLMTLAKIKELNAEVILQGLVGKLHLTAQGVGAAHVNIPSLMAFKSTAASLKRNGTEELLRPCLPSQGVKAEFPMIMARFIADEMDPTVKIKLFNVQVEYTVPAVMAIMGLTDDMTAEDMAINMVASVINLADRPTGLPIRKLVSQSSISSENSTGALQPFRLAITLHDSLIGLNPKGLPSKALLVLTDARLSSELRKEGDLEATVDIKKASIMIIDDVKNVEAAEEGPKQVPSHRDQSLALKEMGYIAIGYISSALASIKMVQLDDGGEKSLDVELRDDLFVLETCADSTQTLLSVLNGLSPPTPPSKVMKYRTEVMPIQDLLASMTGDAFFTDQAAGEDIVHVPEVIDEEPEPEDEGDGVNEFGGDSDYSKSETDGSEEDLSTSILDDNVANSVELSEPSIRSPQVIHDLMNESFQSQDQEAMAMSVLDFKEDHFAMKSAVGGTAHRWNSTQNTYGLTNEVKLHGSPLRVRVRDVHFIWNLFDGYDWQRTRDTISKAVKDVEARATELRVRSGRRMSRDFEEEEENSVIGDFLFNSVYIGVPANRDPRELANDINRGLDDLTSEAESYATTITAGSPSRQGQTTRTKGKKLRLQRSKQHKMTFELGGVSADVIIFPPNSGETQSSVDIRVDELEIFDHVPTSTWKKFATYMYDAGEKETGTSMVHLEILTVKPIPELAASELILKVTVLPLRLHVDQDALDFMSRFFEFKDPSVPIHTSTADVPFVQRAEVNSVKVRLDFKPKRVDYGGLRSGRTTEFMNFFILQEADMVLRHVIIYGISGFDKLGQTLNDIWMPDVKRNQLPTVLAGLAPIRSLVNVGSGVKDLVVVPMREYQKDGRVVRSIQKGAVAFARTTTTELAKLGAKLAIGTQTVLQGAEEFLNKQSAIDSNADADDDDEEKKQISLYADQPVGVVQGLRGAYASLERDLVMARDAIVAVPGEVMESGSAGGAMGVVLRRAPTVILRPAIGASKAVGQTLLGATNSLDKRERRRVDDKYKKH